jgi:hypothetical protein
MNCTCYKFDDTFCPFHGGQQEMVKDHSFIIAAPPSIPWNQVKKKLPKYMHDTESARECLLWLWQCGQASIVADAIPREIHDRLITAVREIYELLAINTADSINAAYLRAKEECEKCS